VFGFLKKKISEVIENLSKKKQETVEQIEKKLEVEPAEAIKEVEKILPETKTEIEKIALAIKKEPEKKTSLFKKIRERIVKAVAEKKLTVEEVVPIINNFATELIAADVAFEVAEKIKLDLINAVVGKEAKRNKIKEVVKETLRKSLLEILNLPKLDLTEEVKKKKPIVVLFLGFNGSGKTTSLAKLAKNLLSQKFTCVFAAADTFRSAAIEQLEEHAKKIGVKVIKHRYGADPAAVVYDAVAYARAHGIDFVLIDTAGRAHTNRNLMDQMQKIIRVNKPDFKILVIDSLIGNDAVAQAKMFNEIGVDGVIFTKVDVNEKGGAILSVANEIKKPILFLGTGQNYESVQKFDAEQFVNNLLS
jgi:fused signal recognition particle receptor